ncbi:MAG: chloride channel protein [Akkermansiaceae bacterium]|nr:chloride channel protein [Akkermansiaceae bacterium]
MKERSGLKLALTAIPLGVVVAFAGIGLLKLIHLITQLSFHGRFSFHESDPGFATFGWPAIFVPALGGLAIGLIARFGSPAIRGHGIPEAMQGVMTGGSRIPLKVAILKPLSTALSIGTGGPFGAEGPIIATGGAIGSLAGQWLPHSAAERKILLSAGAAAGMTAVFGTPLAGVLLAIELLLFEFRSRSLLPVAMAAGAAMAVRGVVGEPFPMLPLPAPDAPGPMLAVGSVVIGAVCGLAAVILTHTLHAIEHAFEKLPFHWMWWPAIGGLVVGLIGWVDPRTMGPGYGNLRTLLDGGMLLPALTALLVLKFLSWSICLGSGTAGGTLAPVMTIGGAVGALTAHALAGLPGFDGFPFGIAALIGMAAIFAGASRAFLTSVAFAFEATHSTATFGPLLLGCAFAILVSKWLMKESIMTEKLARSGVRVPEDYEPDPLHGGTVEELMIRDPLVVGRDMTVGGLGDLISTSSSRWSRARLFPIIGDDRELLGVVSRADIFAAVQENPDPPALEVAITHPITIHPDESLAEAADRMILHEIGRLPVVDRSNPPRLCGIISRREILEARRRRLEDERVKPR